MAAGDKRKGKGRPATKPPVKARARSFAFEGLPEKDRFGIFDPALRGLFTVGTMFAVVFAGGGVLAAAGATAGGWAAAVAFGALIAFAGFSGYKRIWRKPSEREMLLSMAREEDEARVLRARLAKAGGQGTSAGRDPNGERPHE